MSALAIQSRYLDGAPVSFGEAINAALRNAFTYRGRASRSAYWWFYLAITLAYVAIWLIAVLLTATTSTTAAGLIIGLLSLALIYPGLAACALTVRRLRDTDRSGWWFLIGAVPYLGVIILFVILAGKGTPGPNRYDEGTVQVVGPPGTATQLKATISQSSLDALTESRKHDKP
ncbi:MAG TPA: DUF805 domain-containing protein [Streptosporangiaceae bacterium]|nr:DUF805 domain-containing protein [Streptosporangiaceae bacterium]